MDSACLPPAIADRRDGRSAFTCQCSTAITVSPPRTIWPTSNLKSGVGRQEHVHPRAELHDAEPVAGAHLGAHLQRGRRHGARGCRRSGARRPSGRRDRSRSRCARCCSPASGRYAGKKLARRVADAGHPAGHRHPVDVHVHRRKKNADLLPGAGRGRTGLGRAGHQHAAVGRRRARRARRASRRAASVPDRERRKRRTRRARRTGRQAPSRSATPDTSASSSAPPMNGRPAGSRRMMGKGVWRARRQARPRRHRTLIRARVLAGACAGCLPSDLSAAASVF